MAASLLATSARVSPITVLKFEERVMASKSVPRRSQWPRRTSLLCANTSAPPLKLVYFAYWAAILSVTFSPPPATHIGMPPSCSGRGCTIAARSEEHTSELQSRENLVCRLLLEKKN